MPPAPDLPRFRWLKRIAAGSVILLVILTAMWFVWNHDANRRLDAQIAAIRARGEKVSMSDFHLAAVPAVENYVTYYTQAISVENTSVDSPSQSNENFPPNLPFPDEWYSMAAAAVKKNQASLGLMHTARQHPKVDWGLQNQPSPPFVKQGYAPSLNDARNLANLMGDAAQYQHLQADDAQAVETLQDLFALGDAIARYPSLIHFLVAQGLDNLAYFRVSFIAPGLRISGDKSNPSTNPSEKPATRAQVNALLAQLLAIDEPQRFHYAMQAERASYFDNGQWYAQNSPLLAPMYKLDLARALDIWAQRLASTAPGNWPYRPGAILAPPAVNPAYAISHFLSYNAGNMNRLLEIEARTEASLRMASVSLAVRLYRLDHDDAWPPTLDALVPTYLPAVPIDPYSKKPRPLMYAIVNGNRPIVYGSVLDMVDPKWLASMVLPADPIYGSDYRIYNNNVDLRDLSRFLRPAPATAPSTQGR